MKQSNKSRLKTRAKSFAWRGCMVALAMVINFAIENLGLFGLPTGMAVIVGLMLGEVSKELNNRYDLERYLRPTTN